MSGIVGSLFNHRGSGVVAKLGSDGHSFNSGGAGVKAVTEAAAAGGGTTLISTITPTATGTLTSGTIFTSDYTDYTVHFSGIAVDTACDLKFEQIGTSGGGIDSDYDGTQVLYHQPGGGQTQTTSQEGFYYGYGLALTDATINMSNLDAGTFNCVMEIMNPAFETDHKKSRGIICTSWYHTSSDHYHCLYTSLSASYNAVAVGFRIQTSTGDFRARGKIRTYGWNNS